jgi:hypothetical protein
MNANRTLSLVLLALAAIPTFASPISLTVTQGAVYYDHIDGCARDGSAWTRCGVDAFISPNVASSITNFMNTDSFGGGQTLPGGTLDFAEAYDSWFLGPESSGWGSLESGTLNGSMTLNVNVFNARACPSNAGLGQNCDGGNQSGINVVIQDYNPGPGDPTVDQLFWVQALLTNYQPGTAGTDTLHETLDTAAFSNLKDCALLPLPYDGSTPTVRKNSGSGDAPYCGPAYPYQYSDKSFSDSPFAPYPNGSFRGIALLASETSGLDHVNRLTVYGGVNYGFDNWVSNDPIIHAPEPATWILGLAGLAAMASSRRLSAKPGTTPPA